MTSAEIAKNVIRQSGGIAKTAQFHEAGLENYTVCALCEQGVIERVKRGYYQLADTAELTEAQLLSRLLPDAVICLESALFHYRYSDFAPRLWTVAVPRSFSRTKLKIDTVPLKAYFVQEKLFELGKTAVQIDGAPLQRSMLESMRLNNMLWLTEMDQHPLGTEDRIGGDPKKYDETIALLRRNFLQPLFAGEGMWYYEQIMLGYNYRMSNVIAGVVRGQYEYLEEHIAQKKAIYERYKEGFKGLPVQMNPFDGTKCVPNYWLSAMIIDKEAMCQQVRGETDVCFVPEHGKTCPTEILNAIAGINAEGRPIWKPMHMQPMYRMHEFITVEGSGRCRTNAYIAGGVEDVGADIFQRGLCLPSDNKITPEQAGISSETVTAFIKKLEDHGYSAT